MNEFRLVLAAAIALGIIRSALVSVAADPTGYRVPSAALASVVDAPLPPFVTISRDRKHLAICQWSSLPPLSELAQPELRLAGIRINPATNGRSREPYFTGISVKAVAPGDAQKVTGFPANARLTHVVWSPDSRHLACTVRLDNRIELWVVEVARAQARRLTEMPLNNVFISPGWMDARTLFAAFVPADRGAKPGGSELPTGPVVQENLGGKRPSRTYPDMLASTQDEMLFDYYATADLALIGLDGALTPLKQPGIVNEVSRSPDGRLLLLTFLHRPYSYLVPAERFPTKIIAIDRTGKIRHTIADLPLAEEIPIATGSVRKGPRNISWRSDVPATLSWVEALDEGDANRDVPFRDAWVTVAEPFTERPRTLKKFSLRISDPVVWGDGQHALVTESWRKTRAVQTWLMAPDGEESATRLLFKYSSEDRYAHPGSAVSTRNNFDMPVLLMNASRDAIYLDGLGASPEGDRPFVDEFSLPTRATRRLWRSTPPYYENFIAFADADRRDAILKRESVTAPPNYFLQRLVDRDTSHSIPLTQFAHPFPEFSSVKKERIVYQRDDGVVLSGTLYLPPPKFGRKNLPTLMWAYPQDFKSAAAAGQIKDSPYRFVRVNPLGPLPFLLAGYAVLDNPSMPIVGEGNAEPNDTYVQQLVANARAAVDELVRRGISDRNRVAVAGHSYGGFMTANLLAHSDLFRAGIARSGAYNRTLTPFGFQSEERTFWEAPEVYAAMSPFNHAHKIRDPLLLIHGAADNNAGTFPIQSERFFNALKGHGATTRYVSLPHESHTYQARENVLQVLWETETWLNRHLAPKSDAAAATTNN